MCNPHSHPRWKSRKENPQKPTQLRSRSHPRHLVGKRTAQKDITIDTTSDSQVNSNFPNRWSPASLTFNNYFYLFLPSTIQDKSGKYLTEEKEILSRWTEYCSELYNYESCGDNAVLDCSQPPEEDLQPILREDVEIAVASLKKGNSAGVDNIPAELVQAGGATMVDVLTEICNRIWRTGEWPTPWTQSLIITLPKKGNLQLCQNYRTISLISHSSKVMLKVILNRLKPQAEEIIAEEQAGFRAGRSTTEQIFNLRNPV